MEMLYPLEIMERMENGTVKALGFVPPLLPPEAEDEVASAAEAMVLDIFARMDDEDAGVDVRPIMDGMLNPEVFERLADKWGRWPVTANLTVRWAIHAGGSKHATQQFDKPGSEIGGLSEDVMALARVMLGAGEFHRRAEAAGDTETLESVWSVPMYMLHTLDDDTERRWLMEMMLFASSVRLLEPLVQDRFRRDHNKKRAKRKSRNKRR